MLVSPLLAGRADGSGFTPSPPESAPMQLAMAQARPGRAPHWSLDLRRGVIAERNRPVDRLL